MKQTLKPRATSAVDALRVVSEVAPTQPSAAVGDDRTTTLNLRLRVRSVDAIALEAQRRNLTQKQLVAKGLIALGVELDPADLEDRTPRRRRAGQA